MNFIGDLEDPEIKVELKYCERCGGLWLRRRGADGVYCGSCCVRLAALPNVEETPLRKSRSRKTHAPRANVQREDLQSPGRIEYLQGVPTMRWA